RPGTDESGCWSGKHPTGVWSGLKEGKMSYSRSAKEGAEVELSRSFGGEPRQGPELALVQRRPQVRGKFLFVGEEKFYVRGITYGTFRPSENGIDYPAPAIVERDFAEMARNGINTLRTYTVPPRWLLDLAQEYGLRVMVGLPW